MLGLGLGLQRGGMSAFIPTLLPGCKIWVSADYGLTDAGGGALSAWVSRGEGNITSFLQNTGAAQPLIEQGVQNGMPGVLFGSGDFLSSGQTFVRDPAGLTAFAAYKHGEEPGVGHVLGLLHSWITAINRRSFTFHTRVGEYPRLYISAAGQADTEVDTGDVVYSWADGAKWAYGRYSGAGEEFIAAMSQNVAELPTVTATQETFYNASDYAYIGPQYNDIPGSSPASCFIGHIFEVVFYDRALTDDEVAVVANYLNNKWAINQPIGG